MNTKAMINKLNKQYEERLNNTVKMVKVDIKDLQIYKEYVLNNGYCIMHVIYNGCVDDINLHDHSNIEVYQFEFTNNEGFIDITEETAIKWLYEINGN